MSQTGSLTFATRLATAPFRIHGTDLPPNLLLIVKVVLLGLLLKGYQNNLPDVFAPIVPIFEGIPAPHWHRFLKLVVLVAGAALVFNRSVRVSCLAIGAVFIVATMSARTSYHNGTFFLGLIFVMIGLQERGKPPTLLAWQLGVMYIGAGLNKFLEPDWRSGQYFANFLGTMQQSPIYLGLAARLPEGLLPLAMCWQVITMEIAAGILFFLPRFRKVAVWLGTGVHAGAAVLVPQDYGIYLSAVLASYLLILEWPQRLVVTAPRGGVGALLVFLHRLSHRDDPAVDYEVPSSGDLEIRANGRVHAGFSAFWRLALWTPVLYAFAMVVMTFPAGAGFRQIVVHGAGAAGLLAMVVAAVFWFQQRRRLASVPVEST